MWQVSNLPVVCCICLTLRRCSTIGHASNQPLRGTAPYGIFLATVPLHFQSSGRPEWLTPCFGAQSADVHSVLSLASSFRHMTRVANGKRGTARLSPTSTCAAYLRAQSRLFCHIDCGATHSVSKTTRLTSASVWALFRTRTQSRH
ncbi:hypothetical protein B0T12DRAFT_159797 [Alternaria alternata]|nr:hypothetical protein B0T12DRAFT_159797 [Alternaria alternata]